MVSSAHKEELRDRAMAAGLGIGEYMREILFPHNAHSEMGTLRARVRSLEDRVKILEAMIEREKGHD